MKGLKVIYCIQKYRLNIAHIARTLMKELILTYNYRNSLGITNTLRGNNRILFTNKTSTFNNYNTRIQNNYLHNRKKVYLER